MYVQGFKCKVTGKTGQKKLAKAKLPVRCANNDSKRRRGAKQMIVFNLAEGNNVMYPEGEIPAYNEIGGFRAGAQSDTFKQAAGVSP